MEKQVIVRKNNLKKVKPETPGSSQEPVKPQGRWGPLVYRTVGKSKDKENQALFLKLERSQQLGQGPHWLL